MNKKGSCGIPLLAWIISSVVLTAIFHSINKTGQAMAGIVVTSVIVGGILVFIVLALQMTVITSRNASRMRSQRKMDRENGITRYNSIVHIGGLNVPQNMPCNVVLSPGELKVLCGGNEFSLQLGKIRSVDFQMDINDKQYWETSVGRGRWGAQVGGVSGAVIGSAPQVKTKREIKGHAIISYEGINGEYRTFILKDEAPNIKVCAMLVDALRPHISVHTKRVEL